MLLMQKYFMLFNYPIHYYGIISAVGYLIGVIVCCLNAKKRGFKFDDIITCACYVIPLAIIGARLCFVLFNIELFDSFWEIFDITSGGISGLVFYGGVVGGLLGALLYCLIHKKNFLKLADIAVLGLLVGQAIGRWGNFINEEAHGFEVTNPSFQFFPICVEIGGRYFLATFFYEFVNNMIIFTVLEILLYKTNLKSGTIGHLYLIAYSACRFVVEGLRVDCVMIGNLKAAQVTSVLLILYATTYLIVRAIIDRKKAKRNNSPDAKKE